MEEKEIHLRDYLKVISKRRVTVITFFIVIFAVVTVGALSSTPVYRATTKVLIEKSEPRNVSVMNFYYVPYDPEFYETQYQLIKSSAVGRRVVEKLSLDKTYESYFSEQKKGFNLIGSTVRWFRDLSSMILRVVGVGESDSSIQSESKTASDNQPDRTEGLARAIGSSIIVIPIRDSKMVNVSYESTNPKLAAKVVNSVAQAYIDELLEMKMRSSGYAIEWLTEKAEEERRKLEKSEKELQAYMRKHDIVTLQNKLAIVPEKLSEVATKIATAETRRKEMESLYSRLKDIEYIEEAETIPAVASDLSVQSIRQQILKAEQNIMELSKKYGRKHPVMINAVSDLNLLLEKKDEEIQRVIDTIKNDYELARVNESNFRRLASKTKSEMLNLNERFIQYESLKRENETNRQLFDAIMKRIKEQGITQDIHTVDVWVVEKAQVPQSPARPNVPRSILIGMMVGLFGGVGLAFFVEYLDTTVKSPEDAEARLGVPVVGSIQLFKDDGKIEKIVIENPKSVIVESYKALRTAVLLSSAEKPPKNILVTSVEPSEGKTVTAVNLALAVAQSEYSVLLVDSDLRKSAIHKIFDIDNNKGLSTFLAGASDMDIIVPGPVENIHIIPAGPMPPNPSELLSSKKMQELIASINDRFDITIWDSAPLLAVTDSQVLSNALDSTIIVARSGEISYEAVRQGIKVLEDVNSRILGLVINAIDFKKGGYYYYRYYNYSYSDPSSSPKK
jgi:capsular exopolysaccharide synthesis family protein